MNKIPEMHQKCYKTHKPIRFHQKLQLHYNIELPIYKQTFIILQ